MFFGTATLNQKNELTIGGVKINQLIQEHGTPLIVYDVAFIRQRIRAFKQNFLAMNVKGRVFYASKAFSVLAMYRLLEEEGIGCDVVSGGEIYTAKKAGMSSEEIEFHGNNKTRDELAYAVEENLGTIVIDNFYEIELLKEILEERNTTQAVLLRITPGISAETHDYILTGQTDSKFGFDVASNQAQQALEQVLSDKRFNVKGVHCHIGSQIFSSDGFLAAAQKMMEILTDWREKYGFVSEVLNIGGGFGVRYTNEDNPLAPEEFVRVIIEKVKELSVHYDYPLPEIWIEPGRSIVAEAGVTLYEVGAIKRIPNVRTYVSVDGGMGDNLRPALYQARYEATLLNRMEEEKELVTIAGKYCESGDILIHDIELPKLQAKDVLVMGTTGAYGYSMANNYNRNPRPAVIFVENGETSVVVARESFADMVKLDK